MSIINIREECTTQQEAEQIRNRILNAYHPAGYGTSLQIYQQPSDNKWIVEGYRYSSCD
jgi:hypothetical protein